jgi:hypothetical protein
MRLHGKSLLIISLLVAGQTGNTAMPLSLTSSGFSPGCAIPKRYTCKGSDVSPPLALGLPKKYRLTGPTANGLGRYPWTRRAETVRHRRVEVRPRASMAIGDGPTLRLIPMNFVSVSVSISMTPALVEILSPATSLKH